MRLHAIKVHNFRNYDRAEAEFHSDLVLVLGPNAAGKTNFLESIYFLAQLRSFRSPDEWLVRQGQEHFDIAGRYHSQKLSAVVQTEPVLRRAFRADDVKVKRAFWPGFPVVLFVPGDLNLFTAGPQARRKFLDETISQVDKPYA